MACALQTVEPMAECGAGETEASRRLRFRRRRGHIARPVAQPNLSSALTAADLVSRLQRAGEAEEVKVCRAVEASCFFAAAWRATGPHHYAIADLERVTIVFCFEGRGVSIGDTPPQRTRGASSTIVPAACRGT